MNTILISSITLIAGIATPFLAQWILNCTTSRMDRRSKVDSKLLNDVLATVYDEMPRKQIR